MIETIRQQIMDSIMVKRQIFDSPELVEVIGRAAAAIISAYRRGNKVLLCGNGGSASDAQHIEAELVGRFKLDRRALAAVSITANSSDLTSISNDYGFDNIFERQMEAHGTKGDILIAISTSGNSTNVINALVKAKSQGVITITLTGKSGGKCRDYSDITIDVPSGDTPRIQESHIMIGHIICDIVEKELFQEAAGLAR